MGKGKKERDREGRKGKERKWEKKDGSKKSLKNIKLSKETDHWILKRSYRMEKTGFHDTD